VERYIFIRHDIDKNHDFFPAKCIILRIPPFTIIIGHTVDAIDWEVTAII